MTILKIAGVAVLALCMLSVVRASRPELAAPLAVAAGLCILLMVLDGLEAVRDFVDTATHRFGLDGGYIKVVLKVVGIAYIAQFSAQLCRDCGEGALACKVEFAGRLLVLTASLPAIISILELLSSLFDAI